MCVCDVTGEVTYEFHFARYYGNHMVLQRAPGRAIVWGYGPNIDGNTTVLVKLTNDAGFYHEKQTVVKYTGIAYISAAVIFTNPFRSVMFLVSFFGGLQNLRQGIQL